MYSAKRSSSSQLAVYRDGMADEVDRRHLLKAALAGALYRDEMRLVYQPLYRLNDGNLAGAETLLRWTSPLLGVVPPDEFIPLAEDSGEIGRIGLWVLEQSVAQMARWEQQGSYLPRLFVNVSAAQFTDELPAQVARILASQGLSPERLTLEITESQLPGLGVNRSMQALRESGVQIALDDFGTGYSSLAPLARLPVDVVKIDRDFIRNLGEHAGRPVMDAVIQLAKALGLTTVAEGIEDVGQAAEASNAGIDIAQGYLFSHPLTAEDLARRLPRTAPPGSSPASGREANGGSHETSAARPSRFPVPRRAREPLPSAYSDLPNDSTE
jgi:EAL domain-containing protein (putative c-di-GMP-specific phosphodiesterase class I)